jgi:salicylate hydroxylase/6-hydroxynicotinate 3-monooxygenase
MHIGILGAGIGGLTLAGLLLRTAPAGVNVTVYEQTKAFARVGTGIQIGPNAVCVLRELGLEAALEANAFAPRHWRNRAYDTGIVENELELGEPARARYGAPYLLLHRASLHDALRSRVPAEHIRLDHRVTRATREATGVALEFANGTHASVDVLIGADGLNSLVRQTFFQAAQPRYTGRVAYRAVFPASRLGTKTLDDNAKWWGPDRHIVIYYLNPSRGEVYFTTSVPDPHWLDESWSAQGKLDDLRKAFDTFHPEVRQVLEACPQVHKWAIADRDPMARWTDGPVALIGDACHPMTPYMAQGAAQAMEDAMVLTRALGEVNFHDIETAWQLYQGTRHERASTIQKLSHQNQWMQKKTDSQWLYGYDARTAALIS